MIYKKLAALAAATVVVRPSSDDRLSSIVGSFQTVGSRSFHTAVSEHRSSAPERSASRSLPRRAGPGCQRISAGNKSGHAIPVGAEEAGVGGILSA